MFGTLSAMLLTGVVGLLIFLTLKENLRKDTLSRKLTEELDDVLGFIQTRLHHTWKPVLYHYSDRYITDQDKLQYLLEQLVLDPRVRRYLNEVIICEVKGNIFYVTFVLLEENQKYKYDLSSPF